MGRSPTAHPAVGTGPCHWPRTGASQATVILVGEEEEDGFFGQFCIKGQRLGLLETVLTETGQSTGGTVEGALNGIDPVNPSTRTHTLPHTAVSYAIMRSDSSETRLFFFWTRDSNWFIHWVFS